MFDLRSFVDQLTEFWRKRGTLRALFAFFVLINFVIIPAFSYVAYFFFKNAAFIDGPSSFIRFAFMLAGRALVN